MLPFDAEMGKNQKAIKVLQRLFDAAYVTEKEIVNMTMDEMLALPGVNVADLFHSLDPRIHGGVYICHFRLEIPFVVNQPRRIQLPDLFCRTTEITAKT